MSINEAGMDEEEVDRQIAADNARADELGLVFDSDPRRTDARGAEKVEADDPAAMGDAAGGGKQSKSKPGRKEMIQ
jgi:capsid protein